MTDTVRTATAGALDGASWLAGRGFTVFKADHPALPQCVGVGQFHDQATCTDRGKHPAVAFTHRNTKDPDEVRRQFGSGIFNVGIFVGGCQGPKGEQLMVMDSDRPGALEDVANALGHEHTPTMRVTTAKGYHDYYWAPADARLGNSLGALKGKFDGDVRAGNAYVIGPGSVHATGAIYTLEDPTQPPVDAPEWLLAALQDRGSTPARPATGVTISADRYDKYTRNALQAECDAIVNAPEGNQNNQINASAFSIGTIVGAGGLSEGEAWEALFSAARGGNHPEHRAISAINSGLHKGMLKPRTPWPPVSRRNDEAELRALIAPDAGPPIDWSDTQTVAPAGATEDGEAQAVPVRELVFTPASRIKLRRVRWLWDTTPEGAPPTSHGRVPMYCLVIAAGFPGLGKSQFGVWMTARITTGTLPGELYGTPRAVVYAAAEDSWSMTIAPRLIAAGADMDLVFRVDVQDTETAYARLTLPVDTSLLGKAAEAHSVALLVMDPLLSFIDKGVNDYKAAEVRQALEPLVAAADRHHFTILGLAHFTKTGAADPVTRVAGSGAFGQLIRALIAFAKEEGDDGDTRFVMSLEKNNLGRLGVPSHNYAIQPVTVDTEEGPTYVSRFVLGPETATSVSDVMRDEANGGSGSDKTERDEASEWLEDYLMTGGRAGEAPPKEVQAAARAAGISPNALKEAKKRLKVQSVKGTGYHAGWFWTLPDFVPISDDSQGEK